jgi:hypothetical protein
LQYHFNWKTISVASAMTLWNFYFQIFEKAIAKEQVVEFLANLVQQLTCPLLIVWDRLPAHRSRLVAEVRGFSSGTDRPGISAGLRTGTESGRVSVGSLETSRTTQRLSPGPMAAYRRRASLSEPFAPSSAIDHGFLEAGLSVPMNPLYYAGFSSGS